MKINKKFDIQLAHGLRCENELYQRITGSTIELKTESYQWEITGNICIEYEYRGQPSGIAATQADFWCHELRKDCHTLIYLLIPTERLKRLCRYYLAHYGPRIGGDNNWSKIILIPINELLQSLIKV